MRSKRLRRFGYALLILGAVVLVAPSLGFEVIDADRSVTVETASNPDAQLGLENAYDETEIRYTTNAWGLPQEDEQAPVANVTNNVGNPVTVSVDVASIQGNEDRATVLEVSNEAAFVDPMETGATRTVELGCSQAIAGSSQDATVELEIDTTGDPVSVEDATATIDGVAFECEGASGGQAPENPIPINDERIDLQVESTPTASHSGFLGNYSIVSLDLGNAGSQSVTITGVHIADSSVATRVQGDTELQIDSSSPGSLSSQNGLEIGSNEPRYDFDENATLTANEAASVTIGQFRDESGWLDEVDMRSESVTLVLMVDGLNVPGRDGPVPVEMELSVQ